MALLLGPQLAVYTYAGEGSLLPPRAALMLPGKHFNYGLHERWDEGTPHPCNDQRLGPKCGVAAIHFKGGSNKCGMLRRPCLELAGVRGGHLWFSRCRNESSRVAHARAATGGSARTVPAAAIEQRARAELQLQRNRALNTKLVKGSHARP